MSLWPRDDVVARGRRTVVRRKRISDAAEDYTWRSDEELARFDASNPLRMPFEEYERNWSFDMRFTDMAARSFAVEDEGGRHIGNVMYYNYDASRQEAELGISIGLRDRWEHGYGTDAIVTMVAYVFGRTDVRRLYLHTLEWNRRAQRAFEKAGFVDCARSWRGGHTFVVMELRREWATAPAAERRVPA